MYPTDCILWVPFAILVICIEINKDTYVYTFILSRYSKRLKVKIVKGLFSIKVYIHIPLHGERWHRIPGY